MCLLLTAAVDGLGVLLVTLLAVKGIMGEDRVPQALGALAFARPSARGLPAGKREAGSGRESAERGGLRPASAFALLRRLGRGDRGPGLILLALILLGGLLAALLCGKVGKRSNKRLVKSHKSCVPSEKAPSGGAALLFCGVVRYGKILRGIDTTSCVK
ncbi:MAG: hypothetical protein ACLU38_03585 [Dysosmobacter sp.]